MVLDVEAMEGQPLHKPSVIEQITAIIDKGGPFSVVFYGYRWFVYDTRDDKEFKKFSNSWDAKNECERLNSEYVAKTILQCLYDQPIDFKSVYDKEFWQETIWRLMKC